MKTNSSLECFRVLHDEIGASPELNDFIKQYGTVFQQKQFLSAVGEKLEYIVCSTTEKKIVGILPLVVVSKMGLIAYHRPPYCHIYGPVVDESAGFDVGDAITQLLLNVNKFSLIEFMLPLSGKEILPYKQVGASVLTSQTYIVQKDSNYNINSVHSSKKRYLKKLLTELDNGTLTLKEGSDCNETILWLQNKVAERNKFRPYTKILSKIMESHDDTNSYSLLISDLHGNPLAGAFCPFDQTFAYHLVNASNRHANILFDKANILTTYLAVRKAIQKNLSFDFEGSNIPGVANFYKMMGGKPNLLYRIQIPKTLLGRAYFAIRHF
ncbi:MAG: hypothetical protein KDC92_13900 [Bacteroidetes bacterium]|nr:hypothetical protein [Bacteroidota bacterium]